MNESEEKREEQNAHYNAVNTSPDDHRDGAFVGDTDRVNGEYHYRNGYTQKIYSDAHYAPADESAVPPRYYTPPEKTVREPKAPRPPRKPGKGAMIAKIIAICLICALLGGAAGAAIMGGIVSNKLESLRNDVEQLNKEQQAELPNLIPSGINNDGSEIPAAKIYAQACQQVVGISSQVNYINIFGMTTPKAVSGSGFILSENGYILTNYHVVEYAHKAGTEATVMLHDGTKYPAVIVGVEESNDIAVLKIDANKLHPVEFGDSDKLLVGDSVYAVGNPLGELEFSMSTGHVSAKDRLIMTEDKTEPINMFQIDAAVNHGNSGGPVYNNKGQVVGIVTAKYQDNGVEGLGFAIPINDVVSIVNDLITKGYVTGKAYMGVRLDESYNVMYSQYYNMPIGAYVFSVEPGGAADDAGIRAGDIITGLGESNITSHSDLKKAVRQYSAGDTADVTLYRAGETLTLSITFGDLHDSENTAAPASAGPRFANY